MSVIDRFQCPDGSHMPLSNFYPAPITWQAVVYPTTEHYFQAMKSEDMAIRRAVAELSTPGAAKRYGRGRGSSLVLRKDWEAVKLTIMRNALRLKFSRETHPVLVDWLLQTGDALLVEGNDWGDTFWGVCDGEGYNWLGVLLMSRRAELRSGEETLPWG